MFLRNIAIYLHVHTALQLDGQHRVCPSVGIFRTRLSVSYKPVYYILSSLLSFDLLFFASGPRFGIQFWLTAAVGTNHRHPVVLDHQFFIIS
jgi:hypothetical protein